MLFQIPSIIGSFDDFISLILRFVLWALSEEPIKSARGKFPIRQQLLTSLKGCQIERRGERQFPWGYTFDRCQSDTSNFISGSDLNARAWQRKWTAVTMALLRWQVVRLCALPLGKDSGKDSSKDLGCFEWRWDEEVFHSSTRFWFHCCRMIQPPWDFFPCSCWPQGQVLPARGTPEATQWVAVWAGVKTFSLGKDLGRCHNFW